MIVDEVPLLKQSLTYRIHVSVLSSPSQIVKEEVPQDDDEDKPAKEEGAEEDKPADEDEDAAVEEEEEEKPEPKTVDKTVWDWILINENKPIWTRK